MIWHDIPSLPYLELTLNFFQVASKHWLNLEAKEVFYFKYCLIFIVKYVTNGFPVIMRWIRQHCKSRKRQIKLSFHWGTVNWWKIQTGKFESFGRFTFFFPQSLNITVWFATKPRTPFRLPQQSFSSSSFSLWFDLTIFVLPLVRTTYSIIKCKI